MGSEHEALLNYDSTVQYENVEAAQPAHPHGGKKGTTWFSSASIIVANMLGAGVLGLPYACAKMGWIGSIITLVLITLYSVYGGLILGWLRGGDDHIVNYGQLAEKVAKVSNSGSFWKYFCQIIGYIYIIGSCTIYLTTCKLSLMQIFQECDTSNSTANSTLPSQCGSDSCTHHGSADFSDNVWLVIAAAILYPLIHIRSLSDTGIVSYIGVSTIAVVNFIVLGRLIWESTQHHHHSTVSHATSLTPDSLRDFVNGLTQMAFAYGGHVLMVDIQGVMEKPSEWPKAIYLSQSFMFVNYAIVGFLGYSIYGESVSSIITATLPDTWVRILVNVCLFIHVAVAYCINSTVVTKFFFETFWPGLERNPHVTRAGVALRWGVVATAIMGIVFVIGALIPFFSDLMNVYSSLGIFSLSFFVPVIFWTLMTKATSSGAKAAFNSLLILIAVAGCGLGIWAAIEDIANNWKICHYHF